MLTRLLRRRSLLSPRLDLRYHDPSTKGVKSGRCRSRNCILEYSTRSPKSSLTCLVRVLGPFEERPEIFSGTASTIDRSGRTPPTGRKHVGTAVPDFADRLLCRWVASDVFSAVECGLRHRLVGRRPKAGPASARRVSNMLSRGQVTGSN